MNKLLTLPRSAGVLAVNMRGAGSVYFAVEQKAWDFML